MFLSWRYFFDTSIRIKISHVINVEFMVSTSLFLLIIYNFHTTQHFLRLVLVLTCQKCRPEKNDTRMYQLRSECVRGLSSRKKRNSNSVFLVKSLLCEKYWISLQIWWSNLVEWNESHTSKALKSKKEDESVNVLFGGWTSLNWVWIQVHLFVTFVEDNFPSSAPDLCLRLCKHFLIVQCKESDFPKNFQGTVKQ